MFFMFGLPVARPAQLSRLEALESKADHNFYNLAIPDLRANPLPVPLQSGSTQPGESTMLPMWVRGPNLPNYDTTSTTSKATPMMTYIPLTLVSQPSLKVQCSNQLVKSYIIGADQEILVCNLLDEVLNISTFEQQNHGFNHILLSFWNKLKEQVSHTDPQGAAEPTQGMPLVSSFT